MRNPATDGEETMDELIQQNTSNWARRPTDQGSARNRDRLLEAADPDIGDKLDGIMGSLGGAASAAGDQAQELVGAATGGASNAADTAGDAGTSVMDKVKGVFGNN
jgi:hypothetical protein